MPLEARAARVTQDHAGRAVDFTAEHDSNVAIGARRHLSALHQRLFGKILTVGRPKGGSRTGRLAWPPAAPRERHPYNTQRQSPNGARAREARALVILRKRVTRSALSLARLVASSRRSIRLSPMGVVMTTAKKGGRDEPEMALQQYALIDDHGRTLSDHG